MNNKIFKILIIILTTASIAFSQAKIKRLRGEGFYKSTFSNTIGKRNIWLTTQALGYIWDAKEDTVIPHGYMEEFIQIGLFGFAEFEVDAQFLTFLWGKNLKPLSQIRGLIKLTSPNNKDLRLLGYGLQFGYEHSLLDQFVSLGGYRLGGTGFSPDGIKIQGGTIVAKSIFDIDLISKFSSIPIKFVINNGIRIPIDKKFLPYSQYTLSTALAYSGLSFDAFIDWSFDGFFNNSFSPKLFSSKELLNRDGQDWEVAWIENPMYITIGGRFRYPKGTEIYCAIPMLLSKNYGSTMEDYYDDIQNNFPTEKGKQGFDPWYAKWKLVLRLSFPILYHQTGAEMRRNFLLLKNNKSGRKINIDERLKVYENSKKTDELDKKNRLEEIKKRRKKMLELK